MGFVIIPLIVPPEGGLGGVLFKPFYIRHHYHGKNGIYQKQAAMIQFFFYKKVQQQTKCGNTYIGIRCPALHIANKQPCSCISNHPQWLQPYQRRHRLCACIVDAKHQQADMKQSHQWKHYRWPFYKSFYETQFC